MGDSESGMKHGDITRRVIGVFYDVYNELGYGFLESVCQRAMWRALQAEGLAAEMELGVTVWFRGHPVGFFRADLVVENAILVELKCARSLDPAHEAQILNYLRATSLEVGLLLNFGPKPEIRRFVLDNRRKHSRPRTL